MLNAKLLFTITNNRAAAKPYRIKLYKNYTHLVVRMIIQVSSRMLASVVRTKGNCQRPEWFSTTSVYTLSTCDECRPILVLYLLFTRAYVNYLYFNVNLALASRRLWGAFVLLLFYRKSSVSSISTISFTVKLVCAFVGGCCLGKRDVLHKVEGTSFLSSSFRNREFPKISRILLGVLGLLTLCWTKTSSCSASVKFSLSREFSI